MPRSDAGGGHRRGTIRTFPRNAVVVVEGEPAEAMYLILDGTLLAASGQAVDAAPRLIRLSAMLGGHATDLPRGPIGVAMTIFGGARPVRPRPGLLADAFGLTGAEARVAVASASGQAPAEIAEAHGVSVATVRTQLRAVFEKVGVRRQAQLTQVLAHWSIHWSGGAVPSVPTPAGPQEARHRRPTDCPG